MKSILLLLFANILFANESTGDSGIWTKVIIGLIVIAFIYGLIILLRDYGKLIMLFLIGWLLYRGYINYENGGDFLPFNNIGHWFTNEFHLIEGILLFIIFIVMPFRSASAHKCKKCHSTKLTLISRALVDSSDLTNMYTYSKTYLCNKCGTHSSFNEKEQRN